MTLEALISFLVPDVAPPPASGMRPLQVWALPRRETCGSRTLRLSARDDGVDVCFLLKVWWLG